VTSTVVGKTQTKFGIDCRNKGFFHCRSIPQLVFFLAAEAPPDS
jgi:hypothetical protein